MFQKILMGGLALAIVGVVGYGVYDASRVSDTPEVIATTEPVEVTVEATEVPPTATAEVTPMDTSATNPTAAPILAATESVSVTTEPVAPMSENMMGDAWTAMGEITLLEDMGLTLTTADGAYFVELGPPDYWQAQAVTLAEGDTIAVEGFYNGEQVHPVTITTNDGAQLVLRTASGQPAWAGGANHANGGGGTGMSMTQVQADDWLTLTGEIGRVTNGQVTLNVEDGTVVDLQMGRPDFWQSQGITLTVGDPVEVYGFWSASEFLAGDIRKTETGETIMLRDPNGRQLWGGPGRSGNADGGNGNQGNGNQGNGNQGNGNQGNNGNQGGGNQGNGYRGGQGE
jgi:hypothetical protein